MTRVSFFIFFSICFTLIQAPANDTLPGDISAGSQTENQVGSPTWSKSDFHTASQILENFSEPTTSTLAEARRIFSGYKSEIDPEAFEAVPRNQVEDNVLLYIHSFTQGPHEVQSVLDLFTQQHFNVLALSFSGHELDANGKRRLNFRDYSAEDWREDIAFAYRLAKQYGRKVWLLGYSTGGLLALQQYLQNPDRVQALMLFSPALALDIDFSGLSCVGSWAANNIIDLSPEQKTAVEGGCLIRNTITQVFESQSPLLPPEIATRQVLNRIQVPVFIAYTLRDTTVDNWRNRLIKDHTQSEVREYVLTEDDPAGHGDIFMEHNLNHPMSRYDGLTLKQALQGFVQDH
jgi:esterase/lipase